MKVIYKISSIVNKDKFYIGSAVNYKNRVNRHFYELKRNNHKNKILQNHFNKYGKDDLIFSIIEEIENADFLLEREQYYIDLLKPTFNICKQAGSSLGVKRSEEFKQKISNSKKGKKHRPECNIEKSLRQTGKQRKKGYKHTDEARQNISKNNVKKRTIIQMDLDGNFIKEWDSMRLAALTLKTNYVGISMCCRGLLKTSLKYKWKYKN